MMIHRSHRGFTLIELLIVVAVIGILVVIAYPSFNAAIMRSDRADARRALLDVMMAQERFKAADPATKDTLSTATRTYATAVADLASSGLPARLAAGTSERGFYSISIGTATRGGYSVSAEAVNTEKQYKDVACRTITLTITQSGSSKTPAECW